MTERDPTVRSQELGEELCTLRDAAGLTMYQAGARISASSSKISRMESGQRNASAEDVAALLAVYRVTGKRRRRLLELAREAEHRGWWQRHRPNFAERQRTLIHLESKADRITNFEGMMMPGLLQTGEYTRAVMAESGLVTEAEIEDRMVTRLNRHTLLMRRHPPALLALIDELVLHRVVGGVDVLRRQLDHLTEMAQRPNITIRIVPNASGHAGANGAFAVLHQSRGPTVVFLENLTSSLFLEEQSEIETYRQAVRNLADLALDEQQSGELIASLAQRLDTEASRT